MAQEQVLQAFKFALAPTVAQQAVLARHAGASRWAFNHALAAKRKAHERWRAAVDALVGAGVSGAVARRSVKVSVPSKPAVYKAFNRTKGDSRRGVDGVCPWWHEVNTYALQSAFVDADAAWQNWLSSLRGQRAGRRVGYPRFKKKGRARDSFRLHHDVKKPGIRLCGYRRLRLPVIGEVRLHESGKRMGKLVDRGQAVVQSVTVSRRGHRWYASVLCKVTTNLPEKPTRRQRARGRVGVDLGVKHLAVLSQPLDPDDAGSQFVANPRHLQRAEKRLTKAQRALSRTQKGSSRREKAKRRVARRHHEVAVRREGALHQLTKRLATGFAEVAVEDLNVAGMTRSAKGTIDSPGRNVRAKSGLNRAILDAAPGELRRQLTYKTTWHGSKLAVLDRWWPSSKTCSACGWRNPSLTLADRDFSCGNAMCLAVMDRDLNAARNIAAHTASPQLDTDVACDRRETQNARGAPVSPAAPPGVGQGAMKREDTPPQGGVPPQRSDPLASHTHAGKTATNPD